jgi:hypothetical protein
MWDYHNRPSAPAAASDILAQKLRSYFDDCEVYEIDGAYAVFAEGREAEVWCSKSVIRNHGAVLEAIKQQPCDAGGVREWHRNGYIVAVDLVHPKDPEAATSRKGVTTIDIYRDL